MRLSIREFERKDVHAAATLLAARQVRDRARDARLPEKFESPEACRPLVEEAMAGEHALAVVAEHGGDIVGYMVAAPMLVAPTEMTASFFAPRSMNVWYAAHAAGADMEYEVYRELYATVADHFVRAGYFDHNIFVAASDTQVIEACVSLGFGQHVTAAVKALGGAEEARVSGAGLEIHEASSEDIGVIERLNEELLLHHATSPIFMPHAREASPSHVEMQLGLLADTAQNPHFVAYRDGEALGMNTYMAPEWLNEMVRPERCWYLYQGVVSAAARGNGAGAALLERGLAWAREQGYEHVGLHFATANISGGRFWLGHGFTPVEYRMHRHIDERIAWANS